jgi:hypothetical protein
MPLLSTGELTSIRQSKHFITLLETITASFSQTLNRTAKFNPQDRPSLRRKGIFAFSLQKVHTIQAKCFDFHDGLAIGCGRLGNTGDVERIGWANFVLYV